MVNKKGYMRTLEAFAAILLTFIFMMYIIPQFQGGENRRENLDIMDRAIHDDIFRNCVLQNPISTAENCTMNTIDSLLPLTYAYKVEISESRQFNASGLPATRIFTESAMIAGNLTQYTPRYVRVYYWLK